MARPIRETPILYGKDAKRFVEEMKRVESLTPEQRKANREKLQAENRTSFLGTPSKHIRLWGL